MAGVLDLVRQHRPLVVYIVGGEPLVRFRELGVLLPRMCQRHLAVRLVTKFVRFWSERQQVQSIQVSFFTPQRGETSEEILTPTMRERALTELGRLAHIYPKMRVNRSLLGAFRQPPAHPGQCVFARVTRTTRGDDRPQSSGSLTG